MPNLPRVKPGFELGKASLIREGTIFRHCGLDAPGLAATARQLLAKR